MGGNSSKVQFKGTIQRLLSTEVAASDHEFWDELWKTSLSTEEIFEVVSVADIKSIIENRPENFKTLFTQAVAQLYQVVETPYPVYFEQALNCTRLLTRFLPFLIECDKPFVVDLLWRKQKVPKVEEKSMEESTEEESKTPNTDQAMDARETEPLAVILVNALFHLLFLPDFTIDDPNMDFSEEDVHSKEFKSCLMWAPGVGSVEKTVVSSSQFDLNRIDVLRLMVACFSDALFQEPHRHDTCASYWLEVATAAEVPYAEIVFCSLINTVLGYDPIGWGVPYGNLVVADTAKPLMEMAIQTLIILLDYGHPIRPSNSPLAEVSENSDSGDINPSNLPSVGSNEVNTRGFNIFRKLLSQITGEDQLNFLFRGFCRLLKNAHESEQSYLPYSVPRINIEQELMILFWKCLEEIPSFMPYLLKNCDIFEILVPICYFMLEGRKDHAKIGMIYLCTFTLLKLSGERNFGVQLNKPFTSTLPVDLPLFNGTHADLLVIVLHKMIVSGLDKLSALYNCFLTIICNISPYCKGLSSVASVKLLNLFQLFTSPRFLYASEGNHIYVTLLLETFNNIVQYQYEGNVNMIYAIVRRKACFEQLAALTLPAAIENAQTVTASLANNSNTTVDQKSNENKKKKGKEVNNSVKEEEPAVTSIPTDLISTAKVERRATEEGVTEEVKHEESSEESKLQQSHTNQFVPTETWLQAVKAELPLNTLLRLLKHLVPQVESLAVNGASLNENQVIEFIKNTTMVGLLPVPHPIVIRKYQPNRYTSLWFTAFQWGVIFMHNQAVPLYEGMNIKLFTVHTVS